MATKIITKNSAVASAVPTAGDLVQGELAVNVVDKRLYTEDNLGAIVELGTTPSTIDGAVIGGTTPAAGSFTTVDTTGQVVSAGRIDGKSGALFNSQDPAGSGSAALIRAANGFSTASAPDYTFWFDDGVGMFHPAGGTLGFSTASLERMRIDAAGAITASGNITVTKANARIVANSNTGSDVQFRLEENGVFKGGLIWDTSEAKTNIFGTNGGTPALSIDVNNDVFVAGGFYLGGTAAANLLDDYEEGSWTPVIFSSGGGSGTYGTQEGKYSKVGNIVNVSGRISLASHTGSGTISIGPLPFATAVVDSNTTGALMLNNHSVPTGTINICVYAGGNVTQLTPYATQDNGIWQILPLDVGSTIIFSCTYQAA